MNKQLLDGFEIQKHQQGWVNIETGEIGDFKNGEPQRAPLWKRLCGRAKIDLWETEYLGTTTVEHSYIWQSKGTALEAAVYRKYNKFTKRTKNIWCSSDGERIYFSPEAWGKNKKLVQL